MIVSGFLLGLANGGACLATCAAVLVPLFLGEGRKPAENGGLLLRFLAGRLAGYLLFGLLAWLAGGLILIDPALRARLFAAATFILAGLMLAYSLGKLKIAPCAISPRQIRGTMGRLPALRPWIPAVFGLLTGVNICPPFLMAFTNAALNGTLAGSLGFFAAFFVGTSLYLLPVPFVGLFRSHGAALQTVGRLAAALMSFYYIVSGLMLFLEGVIL